MNIQYIAWYGKLQKNKPPKWEYYSNLRHKVELDRVCSENQKWGRFKAQLFS